MNIKSEMSYDPNYYSLDDIFVTQEKIPCQSLTVQKKMGFLDPGTETEDLQQQSVDLPLWYCLAIDNKRNATFKVNIPEIYTSIYTEICTAEAQVVNLSKLNKYFYELGNYISRFDRNGSVAKMVFDTFRMRMKYLKDLCCNKELTDVRNEFGLEFLESELYQVGSATSEKFNNWLQDENSCGNIEASLAIVNHRKRKRENCEADDIL